MTLRSAVRIVLACAGAATFAAAGASPARAQGTTFTYQGHLEDAGAPAAGLHDLRFRLYDAAAAGAQLGSTLCVDDVPVIEGVFTVQLDFGAQFATTAERHLEIDARRDTGLSCGDATGFETLAPRQAITAAPMASHAAAAFALDAADGSPASAVYVDNDGKVGIGTTSPGATLHIKTPDEGIRVQGSGAGNANTAWIGFSESDGTALGWVGDGSSQDRNTYLASYVADVILYTTSAALTAKANGDVGIGTTAPAAKLDVRGDIKLGSSGQYQAAGGTETLRLCRGTIDDSGSTLAGSGFTSSRVLQGVYRVNFSTAFSGTPSVTVTPRLISGVRHVAYTWLVSSTGFNVYVYNSAGAVTDTDFDFCVIGPR